MLIKMLLFKISLFSFGINNNMNFHNITIYSHDLLFKHTTKEKKKCILKNKSYLKVMIIENISIKEDDKI